jgi:pyruvate/2-oxoglutarate dehydrogenase complex dihydrolipoamide acyltransferase (E2) component
LATEVLLPQWGMGMQEGTVVSWLKSEGDAVTEGEAIVEVEAEKVSATIEAPASGILESIKVREGETVRIYSTLGLIKSEDETA